MIIHGIEFPDYCPSSCRFAMSPYGVSKWCTRCPIYCCLLSDSPMMMDEYDKEWAVEWRKFFSKEVEYPNLSGGGGSMVIDMPTSISVTFIKPRYEIVGSTENIYNFIERISRTCYKSEDKITDDSSVKMVDKLRKRGHTPMLEFADIVVKFVVDRGVSHELVRHRLCSFAQESTRYVNYDKKGFTFIIPPWFDVKEGTYKSASAVKYNKSDPRCHVWIMHMFDSAVTYAKMLSAGMTPEQARAVLPNSTKTEINVKANITEWRHILKLRTNKRAHPQMREVMIPLLRDFGRWWPELFGDILEEVTE